MTVQARFQQDGSVLIRVPVGTTADDAAKYLEVRAVLDARRRGEPVDLAVLLSQRTWDESKIHRGQPENAGEFGPGGGHAEHGEGSLRKKKVAAPVGRTDAGAGKGERMKGDKVAASSPLGKVYAPDPTASTREDGVADAARVGVPAHQVPPPPAIGRLPNLEPDQRAVENRFNMAYQKNPQKFVDAYVAGKNNLVGFKLKEKDAGKLAGIVKEATEAGFKVKVDQKEPEKASISGEMGKLRVFSQTTLGGVKAEPVYEIGDAPNIFNTDDCKMLSDVYNPKDKSTDEVHAARSQYNTVLHASANAISKKAFVKFLDEDMAKLPPEKRTVLVTSGGVACHGKDTPVLLWNDKVKMVQDVEVGDYLIGPDFTVRTVQETHRGVAELWRIVPAAGDPFVVNAAHTMHLCTLESGAPVNITVRYLVSNAKMMSHLLLPRARRRPKYEMVSFCIEPAGFGEFFGFSLDKDRLFLLEDGTISHNSGKGYALGRVDAVNSVAKQAGAVWDAAGEACAVENPWILDECRKRGIKASFVFVHSDPEETWENPERGVVERAQKIGRMVNARSFAESYVLGAKNFDAFHKAHKDEANFFILDNTGEEPKVLDAVPPEAMQLDVDALNRRCVEYLQNSDVKPAIKRGGLDSERIWPAAQNQDRPA